MPSNTTRSGTRRPAGSTARPGAAGSRPRTTSKSTPDVIAVLKQDHRHVREMFRRYKTLGARANRSRERIAEQVTKELSKHAAAEEQVLYPSVRKLSGGERMADHALDEHQQVKELLTKLLRTKPDSDAHGRLMTELERAVQQHVREEEGDVFPKLRRESSRDELKRMGTMIRTAKRAAPTRPHPHAPSTPPGNIIAGAVSAVADRARDALRGATRR